MNGVNGRKVLNLKGAGGRNRTADTGIFSPLLYRLSYPGSEQGLYFTRIILGAQTQEKRAARRPPISVKYLTG